MTAETNGHGTIWSQEAELGVLGSPFVDSDAVDEVRSLIGEADFFREPHRRIWRSMVEVRDQGGPVDLVTVMDRLKSRGELDQVGGLEYLSELIDAVPSSANAGHYARIIRDKARLRRLVKACRETAHQAMEPEGSNPDQVFEDAERRILEAGGVAKGSGDYRPVTDVIWGAMGLIEEEAEAKGGITGIPSGFSSLDWMTAGMQPGELTIVAGRPSMGKTAWALAAAMSAANARHPTAFASLEMTGEQLVKRSLAMRADIDLQKIRRGELTDAQYSAINDASAWIHNLPFWIDDTASAGLPELRVKMRRMKARHGLELLAVDYLQLMDGEGENRVQQVSSISRGLKLLAKELQIHVMALSQLSRAVEHRKPPRPQLSDLRDSGAIEQDADVVLLLWRPEYYFTDKTSDEARAKWQGRGELLVGKQRNGPTGRVMLQWDAKTTRFIEEERRMVPA